MASDKARNAKPDTAPYVTPDTIPRHTRSKISKLNEIFIDEIRNNEKKKTLRCSKHILDSKIHLLLAEALFNTDQTKNNQIVNQAIDSVNELKNAVTEKENPENENSNKIIDITEKVFSFNNQQENTNS